MSQAATPVEKVHITRTPGVCGGKPCIAGHRIRVQDIYVLHERRGLSADEIVAEYPQISHADVYAALAYFWDHRDEILGEMRAAEAVADQMRSKYPSKLHEKLKKPDAPEVSS
jgi:uncharacterized protein (DUF433 family)